MRDRLEAMTEATRELLNRALALPPGELMKLAHEPLGSVVADEEGDAIDELDPEFLAELERRVSDDRPGIPAEDAFKEVERRPRGAPRS